VQKQEVEKQKEVVDEKNKSLEVAYKHIEEKNTEILDSIRYAKRIQEAILPPQKLVKSYLENSFILYKPKDIVAGDFYWMHVTESKVLFASVDCTGHGVPGAFVSILGFNGLNRCVKEFGLTQPAAILDKLCEIVDEAFSKSEADIKDGMDIALCSYDHKNSTLEYSGAGNSLYHIREKNLTEYSADKQPVGKYAYRKRFTNHTVELKKNDAIYIFTDGYADQFGGPKGKKFKYSQFEKLLVAIHDKSMEEQREILNGTIDEWRGELEQIDDICIIGVRI
jgi:serine phosphatase RsbU (regulator of sigma subunit)